jgi:cyclophilin family peptidyl-prolyl cis-trans isomerase
MVIKSVIKMRYLSIVACLLITQFGLAAEAKDASTNPMIKLETEKGDITLELFPSKAPISVDNFIKYANDFHYDGLIFHRVIKGFMIQSGGFTFDLTPRLPTRAPIVNESKNGLTNGRGTIAMARSGDPDSAQAQFYINHRGDMLPDAKGDKMGYAVFGRVTRGMDVVDAIAKVRTQTVSMYQDVPVEPVRILTARLLNPEIWTPLKDPEPAAPAFERPVPLK